MTALEFLSTFLDKVPAEYPQPMFQGTGADTGGRPLRSRFRQELKAGVMWQQKRTNLACFRGTREPTSPIAVRSELPLALHGVKHAPSQISATGGKP